MKLATGAAKRRAQVALCPRIVRPTMEALDIALAYQVRPYSARLNRNRLDFPRAEPQSASFILQMLQNGLGHASASCGIETALDYCLLLTAFIGVFLPTDNFAAL